MTDLLGFAFEIALMWMSQDFIDDTSTLILVMAWCSQAKKNITLIDID